MQFGAKPLFENISVKFGNGNRYGLIGANGCGKSTFMKILGFDLEPSAGNVMVDPNERVGKLRQDQFAYEEMAEDGTWGVWTNADLVGDPYDWGTYTFDGETLVYSNAEGSFCDGAVAIWTVEFSDSGQEARLTFVEDSCTTPGVTRAKDQVLVRQTP